MTTTPFAPVFEGVPAGTFVDLTFLEVGLEQVGLGQFGALPRAGTAIVEAARELSEIIAGDRRSSYYDPQNLRRKLSELIQKNSRFAVAVTRALGLVQQGLRPIGAEVGARRFGEFDPSILLRSKATSTRRPAGISATADGVAIGASETSRAPRVMAQGSSDVPATGAAGNPQPERQVALVENLPPASAGIMDTYPTGGISSFQFIDFTFSTQGISCQTSLRFFQDRRIEAHFSANSKTLEKAFVFEFFRDGRKFAEFSTVSLFPESRTLLPTGHSVSELFDTGVASVTVRVMEMPLVFHDVTRPVAVPLNIFLRSHGAVSLSSGLHQNFQSGSSQRIGLLNITVSSAGEVGVLAVGLRQRGRFYVDLTLSRDGMLTPVSNDAEGILHDPPEDETDQQFFRVMTEAEKTALSGALRGNFGLLTGESGNVQLDRGVDIIATVHFVPEGKSSK